MSIRSRRRLLLGVAATLGLGFVSCDKSPTSPSTGSSSPPSAIVRLELVAPQEIAPGESVQLTASAVKSDGALDNVTSQAQWSVQSVPTSSVLALTGTGLVTGGERGRGLVTVRFASLTADATIFVLPKDTFRLTGRITAGGVGLEHVTVTVISGVGEGLTARTDVSGEYELYGVAGPVQIRASKEGYFDRDQQVGVTAHGSHAFELTANRNYSGDYTLTIRAGRCTSGFPDAAKQRVYTARLEQTGADLRVFLTGADFVIDSGTFAGVVTPTGEIRFTIRPVSVWDYDAFDLRERLSDGTRLIVGGIIIARATSAGIMGRTGPDVDHFHRYMRLNNSDARCDIDRFEMVPR